MSSNSYKSDPSIDLMYLTVAILGLFILKHFSIPRANGVMAAVIVGATALLVSLWGNQGTLRQKTIMDTWIKFTLVGFFVGALSDLVMNIAVHIFRARGNTNTSNMVRYFTLTGSLNSAFFAGLITSLMVLNTVAFVNITEVPNTFLYTTLAGFAVGALWGVVVEVWNAKAARNLMLFYKNTSGFLENRVWDGLSIALAVNLTKLIIDN